MLVLAHFYSKTSRTLLDWLFPPRCASCGQTGSWFCESCLARVTFIYPPICQRCGRGTAAPTLSLCRSCTDTFLPAIDAIRAAAIFEDNPIRPAIHSFKYRNQKVLASPLGTVLVDAYRRYGLAAEVVVPVPLHPDRFRERGYNQSELLAQEVGRQLGLPVNTTTLRRVRRTRIQMTLNAEERHQNVAGAFAGTNDDLAGCCVLLIDDVCTTGSTLAACAAALKERLVTSVWGLTLARVR